MRCQPSKGPPATWQESVLPEPVPMESDPIVCVDAPGVFVRAACCTAVSQRRLMACLACAALLACMSSTALLHWPHQMRTIGEAKEDLVLLPDSNMYAAWATIRWAKHPTKCLDVAGEHGGAQLQIWSCSDEFPKKQRFIAPPPGTAGQIKWATHPELCLDNSIRNELQMWHCRGCSPEKCNFKISPHGKGRIVLADQPNKCVDIPAGAVKDGWKVQLWDCDDSISRGRGDNIRWITGAGVDCKWGTWSSWSACPVTCGGGSHVRSRTIEVNATGSGRACTSSDNMEMGSCGSGQCEMVQQDTVQSTVTTTTLDLSYFITTTSLPLSYNFIATTSTVTTTTMDLSYKFITTTEGVQGNGKSGTVRPRVNMRYHWQVSLFHGFARGRYNPFILLPPLLMLALPL
mmetsp:Transcript_55281/g.109823  ORF Transcript_55281/g.109823 Transcript_55281/m.109823 type:complete len:403 (-) Transcript_55281:62-1270(-)